MGFEQYRKLTRREQFLKTMEAIVPWSALCEVIEPQYPKAGNGRPLGIGLVAFSPLGRGFLAGTAKRAES